MVWCFIWPALHPKYVHPPGTAINFFHLRVFHDFGQNFSRPLCAWWVHIPVQLFPKGETSTQTMFWCNFGQKNFPKILRLNSKGKVAIWPFWDRFSSAKNVFLTCYGTSSKHHRRCLEVQRTRLKQFLTSEPKWGLLRLETHLVAKIGIFWAEISDGCAYVCTYFLVGCVTQKGPKGSYFCGKSGPTSIRYLVLKKIDFE